MMNILELIKNEKVEWKKLGEVCENKFWMMPATPKFISQQGIPYITGKNIRQGKIDYSNVKYIAEEDFNQISKNRELKIDDVLISMIGTIGEIGIIRENRKFYGQNLYVLRLDKNQIMNMYFYYYFSQDIVKNSLISKKNNSSQGYIRAGQLESLEIPIPSLETQEKIVEILDKFTNYVAELQSELQLRTKQYEYYREKLLTFDKDCDSTHARTLILSNHYYDLLEEVSKFVEVDIEDKVEWLKLSDFCKRQKGISITAKQMQELDTQDGRVKVFAGGNTVAFLEENVVGNDNIIDKPSIIVKSRGNIDFEFYDNLFTHKNEMWSYSVNTGDDIKYVFYYLKNHVEYFKNKAISGKLPQISTGVTDNFKIPLPPLHVQQHIVSILDKFDTLVHDIKEGLPKEIELRQKQYEYWREQLLSFNR